jgi:hypothetical protein
MAPAVVVPFVIAFTAIQLLGHGENLVGIALLAVGAITGVLAFRRLLAFRTAIAADEGAGNLSGAVFDHLVWIAIGVPIVFAVLLLLLLVSNQR